MLRQQLPGLPEIAIEEWEGLAVPREELSAALAYLAYKTGRSVRMKGSSEGLYYSSDVVMLYPCPLDTSALPEEEMWLKLGDQEYQLDPRQHRFEVESPAGRQISDGNGLTLATVEHNCIVLHIALLNADNQAARMGLSHIVEKAIPLLDFQVGAIRRKQFEAMKAELAAFFSAAIAGRLEEKRNDLQAAERDAENAYHTIIEAERRKLLLTEEIETLERAGRISPARLAGQQAAALHELRESGLYEEIRLMPDGAVSATTGEIVIHYNGWKFHLGRYQVEIDRVGDLKIHNLDRHERAQHPHPHIGTDFRPCLGNIAADLGRMIGKVRIAEALQVIHQFLCSYNRDNPYERIAYFDPTGEFYDEDDDPCSECEEKCSNYCIFECGNNDGQYGCSDCYDYRTVHCFTECSHNEGFECVYPCEGCSDEGSERCYLECAYNDGWQLCNPCDDCEFEACDTSCPYRKRKEELDHDESRTTQEARS